MNTVPIVQEFGVELIPVHDEMARRMGLQSSWESNVGRPPPSVVNILTQITSFSS
jgi:hypothetical protein